MRPTAGRQLLLPLQKVNHRFQFVQIFTLLFYPPQIPLKSGGRAEFQWHQIRSRNSRNERYRLSPLISFASFIASMVA